MLTVADNKKTLLKDGLPFFYLADTCWSAFTNITDDEWEFYLHHRKMQGFNVIQINILPQWDASETDLNYIPFINGDWYTINDEYFKHARKMCLRAKEEGFELALVLLWCNLVPDTWGSKMFETRKIPYDAIDFYVKKVHETFSDLKPLYIISGDTDFNTDETVRYYVKAGTLIKKLAPECLYTAHIKGRYTYLPRELYKLLDIVFYQSGHNSKDRTKPYSQAEEMLEKYAGKPLINSEPCYEEMGYSGKTYGRWSRRDVRRAAYVSVLSGASAGITYGAAGIYSWHRINKNYAAVLGEGFDAPKSWNEALLFPGAWDYGFLKRIFEQLNINDLVPRQDLLMNLTDEIRVAQNSNNLILAYVPYNTKVRLDVDLSGWKVQAISLTDHNIADLDYEIINEKMVISMHPFSEDALYILKK